MVVPGVHRFTASSDLENHLIAIRSWAASFLFPVRKKQRWMAGYLYF